MDYLLNSRLDRTESPLKLDNLSPDKFGRSAYANLSYTPSKLATNVIFKQVSSMRRVEQSSSKAREWQALNGFLNERLKHLQEEKQAVEKASAQQIAMYKRMISEMENTHEKRIRSLQALFSEEIQKIILIKEEEAKYVQSQKQLLENRIYELEEVIASLKAQLQNQIEANQQADKANQELKHKNQQLQAKIKEQISGKQRERQEFSKQKQLREAQFIKKMGEKESQFAKKMEQFNLQKHQIIENIKNTHQKQLKLLEEQRINQTKAKEEQLRQLKSSLQSERKRFDQIIKQKEQAVQKLSNALRQEKETMTNLIKRHEKQVATMTNEKQKILQDAETSAREAVLSKEQLKKYQTNSTQTTANLQASIDKLKREAQALHRQRQGLLYENEDIRRQVLILRKSVEKTSYVVEENSIMSKQLKHLKDLLMESSLEMERCKGEFMRLDKEKEVLLGKMRELDLENETLYRIKMEMEEEARVWRQTYYMARR